MQKRSMMMAAALVAIAAGSAVTLSGGRAMARGDESAAKAPASAATFKVDAVHSGVVYRVGHLGVAYHYGMFAAPTGMYTIDLNDPSKSSMEMQVSLDKLDSGNEKRDGHLRSPDFFNAEKFATITFKSTSFAKGGDKEFKVKGDLTLLGVTKPVDVNVKWVGEGETAQGYKSGFEAEFKFKRSDFGMTGFLEKNAIGDEVTIYATIEGKKQ